MDKKNSGRESQAGFTLLELVIYTAIFASVAGLLTSILVTTTKVSTNQAATTQVSNELNLVLSTVQSQVRSSANIECVSNSDCSLASGSYLKLRFQDPTLDPTCVYLSGTQILLAQGPDATNSQNCTSVTQAITTSKVNATSLTFTKFDNPGGHATIQIDATLTYNSTSPDMQISKTLRSAIGRVSAATFDSDLLPDLTNQRSIGTSVGPKTWKNIFLSGGLVTPKIYPSTDSTTAIQFTKADGLTNILNIDTTNGNVGIGTTGPGSALDIKGTLRLSGATSGYVGLAPAAAAGGTTYTLPSADGTSGQVLSTSGAGVLSWATPSSGGDITKIAQTTLSSPAANVVFSSIPTTYRNLRIVYQAKSTYAGGSDGTILRINGDTAGNYDSQTQDAANATLWAGEAYAATFIYLGPVAAATSLAGSSGAGEIEIPNYTGTTFNKIVLTKGYYIEGTSAGLQRIRISGGRWRNTVAITSLTFAAANGNLDTGSVVTLYGEL